ncbi:sugar transferase [Natrinema salsiterrestre]|uniref:Sugar transferase n=1 Tax=Natrinema salsiterrestre TaxID=2950540 RepID=A0A9Q4PZ27_9EURY|nr:sugar transferase [Natrinema salsiterrestre]MDF9743985.1 sugar transferase [Natrinema salsiterrestre]
MTGGCVGLPDLWFLGSRHGTGTGAISLVGPLVFGTAFSERRRSRPRDDTARGTLIVGDDPTLIGETIESLPVTPVGLLSPPIDPSSTRSADRSTAGRDPLDADTTPVERRDRGSGTENRSRNREEAGESTVTGDGAPVVTRRSVPFDGVERLGPPSRLRGVLRDRDIDTVVLAVEEPDREVFFESMRICRDVGVDVMAHERHRESLLVSDDAAGDLVTVDVDPWGGFDRLWKRLFDVVVAGGSLLLCLPAVVLLGLAIRIEGAGPVFFSQTRTSIFGNTFPIRKFRTLKPKRGGEVGTEIDEDRYTTLGRFLRTTHLDEIPQLWSILVGEMSIVGPRPAQTELEPEFEREAPGWRRRWFVKPGLTGLAQIHGATSSEPQAKLECDLEYIRRRSLRFDLRIVGRQLHTVVVDVVDLLSSE